MFLIVASVNFVILFLTLSLIQTKMDEPVIERHEIKKEFLGLNDKGSGLESKKIGGCNVWISPSLPVIYNMGLGCRFRNF